MTYTQSLGATGDFADAAERSIPNDRYLDCWSYYDFKPKFLETTPVQGLTIPSWVPQDHRRRLRAYELLEAYYKLCARRWINDTYSAQRDRREYGDAYLLVEANLASVMGNDQKILVEGTSGDSPDPDAVATRDLLTQWMDDENFELRMTEAERNAVKMGDGIYVVGWDSKKKRPRLRVYDPGFYFPVEDPRSDEDYPEKVHIAYEYEEPKPGARLQNEKFVRRITWELRDVTPYPTPWGTAEENCFYSDYTWKLDDTRGDVWDFDLSRAVRIDADNVPLGVDFIPVVHVPNMSLEGYIWGTSVIASVVQLLDDLVATDTDLQNASALTGAPIIGVSGATLPKDAEGHVARYGPGDFLELGADGKLTYVDTATSLDALIKLQEAQLDRMSVNARTPSSLIGRI
jgi:hypothetical protein